MARHVKPRYDQQVCLEGTQYMEHVGCEQVPGRFVCLLFSNQDAPGSVCVDKPAPNTVPFWLNKLEYGFRGGNGVRRAILVKGF